MILLLLSYPFLTAGTPRRIVLNVLMSAIFFFGIRTVSDSRKHVVVAVTIAVPWFVLTWWEMIAAESGVALSVAVNALSLGFFAFTAGVLLAYVLTSKRVTRHFAVAEAVVGVMYLAIIISRLVGLYIAPSRSTDPTLPGGPAKRLG